MTLEPASPEDAEELSEIAFSAKGHWGYPVEWMECWRESLTIRPASLGSQETIVAKVEGRIAGFYAVGVREGRLQLLHLWVRPAWMRRGVGAALFLHAAKCGQRLGFRELQVEADPNAEGFYLRMGARRVGISVGEVAGCRRELPVLIYEMDCPGTYPPKRSRPSQGHE